jgi:hypothetical protein
MAGSMHELTPWNRRPLPIPPDSRPAWVRLALWQMWMGALVCAIVGFGALLIVTAPSRLIVVQDYGNCYSSNAVAHPCVRGEAGAAPQGIVYRTGALYALFSLLAGSLMMVLAAWLLWELWSAAAPRPLTDDFLKLLHDSFARRWRDPRTWPWTRLAWAYGFTLLGAALTAGTAALIWTLASPRLARPPASTVETTTQIFRVDEQTR